MPSASPPNARVAEIKSANLINFKLLVPGGTEFKDDSVDILSNDRIPRTCARKGGLEVAPDGSIYFWVNKRGKNRNSVSLKVGKQVARVDVMKSRREIVH